MRKKEVMKKVWSILLALVLVLGNFPAPVHAHAQELEHGEGVVETTAPVESVAPVTTAPETDEAVASLQALIDALPDSVTAENADSVAAQLSAIDAAKLALTETQLAQVDFARYVAAAAALGSVYDTAPAETEYAGGIAGSGEGTGSTDTSTTDPGTSAGGILGSGEGTGTTDPGTTTDPSTTDPGTNPGGITGSGGDGEISDASNSSVYMVSIAEMTNGTVSADKTTAAEGTTVTLTVTPDEGYELDTLTVTNGAEVSVEVTNNTFTMPGSAVTVSAVFKAKASEPVVTNTIYFDNSAAQWSTVNAYTCDADGNAYLNPWPGTAMTLEAENIYSVAVPAGAEQIIFNNGSDQTDDLTLGTGNCFKAAADGSGSWYTYPCTHADSIYTVNTDGTHTRICAVCGTEETVPHGAFTESEDGKTAACACGVEATFSVMSGNETKYYMGTEFNDMMPVITAGSVVKLYADLSDYQLSIYHNCTLDLNGYTITVSFDLYVSMSVECTIKNGTISSTASSNYSQAIMVSGAYVTLENVAVCGNNAWFGVDVSDGVLTIGENCVISGKTASICASYGGTVSMTDTPAAGTTYSVYMDSPGTFAYGMGGYQQYFTSAVPGCVVTESYGNLALSACDHTGGTFTYRDNEDGTHTAVCSICGGDATEPEDHDYNTAGTCTVCAAQAQAKVGENFYLTLTDAIAAARDIENSTLTLLTDVTGNYTVASGTFTLDLNGKTITGTASIAMMVNQGAELTITDSSAAKNGTITSSNYGVFNSGTLNVPGGIISGYGYGVYNTGTLNVPSGTISGGYYGVYNTGVMTVTGGMIEAQNGNSNGVYNGSGAELTVENGTISGYKNGVWNEGTMTVTGGTITGNAFAVDNDGTVTVKSGTIRATGSGGISVYNRSNGEMTMKDGTITGAYALDNYGTLTVEGGTITADGIAVTSAGTVNITGGTITGGSLGVSNFGTVNITGGTIIDAPTDFNIGTDATTTLTGGTFPGGIYVTGGTLKSLLGTGCAYYIGTDLQTPAADATALTGGTVTVQTCRHDKATCTDNGDGTHTVTCAGCGQVQGDAKPHNYTNGTCADCGHVLTYTVTLRGAGGTLNGEGVVELTLGYPWELKLSDYAFTREGYTLLGWSGAVSGNINATDTVTVDRDMNLVAQWQINTYNVYWQVSGQTVYTSPVEYGSPIIPPNSDNVTIPEGYYSVEWDMGSDPITMGAGDVTVTGYWKVYLAIIDEDGDTLSFKQCRAGESVQTEYYGDYYKEGHTFYLANYEDETERYAMTYASGMPVWPSVTATKNLTLKPLFVPNTYKINWINGDTTETVSVTYGESFTLPDAAPVREGHEFLHWNTAPDGTGVIVEPGTYSTPGDSDFYACFSVNSYKVTWNLNGFGFTEAPEDGTVSTYEYGTQVSQKIIPSTEQTGYTLYFVDQDGKRYEWQEESNQVVIDPMPAKDLVLTAMYDYPVSVIISTGLTADQSVATHKTEFVTTLSAPAGTSIRIRSVRVYSDISNLDNSTEIRDYTFKNNILTIHAQYVTGKIVIIAQACIDLTLDANGGQFPDGTTIMTAPFDYQEQPDFTTEQLATLVTREGYTPVGLNTKADGTGISSNFNTTQDLTLYVTWQLNRHTLTWIIDGETTTETVAYGTALTAPEDPSKEGHVFNGWTGDTIPDTMPDEDITITLTSRWTKVHNVTFNANGGAWGTETTKTLTVLDGKTVTLPEAPEKKQVECTASYTFEGWSTAPNGTPLQSLPAATEDVTYYAIYTETPVSHTPKEAVKENLVEATCEAEGSFDMVVYCETCGEELERESYTTNKTGHNYNGVVTTAPTCTEDGVKTYTCQNDESHTYTESVDKLGHTDEDTDHNCDRGCGKTDMGEHADSANDRDHLCDYGCGATLTECADNDSDHLCDECGSLLSDCADSDNDHLCDICKLRMTECYDQNGDRDHNCDTCGKENLTAHTYSDATCETAATCYECGGTTGEALGHIDENKDHNCDHGCGKAGMGEHADAGMDHACDYGCSVAIGTCEDANMDHNCDYGCGKTYGDHADANNDHMCDYCSEKVSEHNYIPVVTPPTCTDPGYTTHTCDICGYGYVDTYVDIIAHADNDNDHFCDACKLQMTVCYDQNGDGNHNCDTCGAPDVSEHDCSEATCEEAATCYECGGTTGEALGHTPKEAVEENRVDATCEANGSYDMVTYCETCGEELDRVSHTIDAIGHDYDDGEVTTAPTCTEDGVKTYTCQNDKSHTKTEPVNALGHDKVNHTAQAATCEAIGWNAYETCTRCDYSTYEEIPALGHTPKEAVEENRVDATCEADGSCDSVIYCAECRAELSRTTHTIPATGHSYTSVITKPTCTEGGYTTHTCSVCVHSYVDSGTEAKGHTPGEAVRENEAAASCTTAGSYEEATYCTVCKTEISRVRHLIPAGGHQDANGDFICDVCKTDLCVDHIVETVPGYAATCTTDGLTDGSRCSKCGEILLVQEAVPAKNHDWDVGAVTTQPTCTEAGVKTFTCRNDASHTYTESVPATGHSYGQWIETKAATCTVKGEERRDCSSCDAYEIRETEMIAHSYGTQWEMDASGHWHQCSCGAKADEAAHTSGGAATGDTAEICTICGYVIAPATGGSDADNQVTIGDTEGGKIELSDETPATGEDVTITVTPDEGKEIDQITVRDEDGNPVEVTDNGDGTYTYEQPDGDVTIEVTFKDETPVPDTGNDVTIEDIDGGKVEIDDETPATGEDVTITVTPDEGKEIDEITVRDEDGNPVEVTDNGDGTYTYEQPDGDVTIEVTFKDETPVPDTGNDVTIEDIDGGKVEIDDETPATGEDVTITVTPDEGKEIDEITVRDEDGNPVEVTDNGDGTYTYEQPDGDVTIEVTFKDEEHAHSYTKIVTVPTCTEKGYTTYTCACGDSYVDDVVKATGHSFSDYKPDGNATCKKNGTKTAECDHGCGETDTKTDFGSKLGHNYVDGKCTRCGVSQWNPDTGDRIVIAVVVMIASGTAIAILVILARKKKKM